MVLIPLAEKLNPAASQQNVVPLSGQVVSWWPPSDEHKERIKRYKQYRSMYVGNHEAALQLEMPQGCNTLVACNLPSLVVTIPADIAAGEPFTIDYLDDTPESEGEPKEQQTVDEIWSRNNLQTTIFETLVDTGYYGDGLFAVSRGDDGKALVRAVNPTFWYPEHDPDDSRNILVHRLVWDREIQVGKEKRKFIRVIEHYPGRVEHKLYLVKDDKVKRAATPAEWAVLYPDGKPPDVEPTEVDQFLLVHLPNTRTASEYHGRSDYRGRESLFGELDELLTQAAHIIRRHADPSWSLPASMFQWLEKQYPNMVGVPPEMLYFLKQDGDSNHRPERITWDGKLDDLFKLIEEVTGKILMLCEIDKQLVGLGEGGAESGTALRLRLVRTMSKVKRKWQYTKPAIEKVLELAQLIEGVKPIALEIMASDGLPGDTLQDIQAARDRIDAGLSTHVDEIMNIHDESRADAEKHWERIQAEDDTARNSEPLQSGLGRAKTPIRVDLGGLE